MTANIGGRPLYPPFQFLPSERRYPEYYSVIDNPIDLKTIAQKIQASEYNTLNDLEKDLLLMVWNACLFNEPGSQLYKDARALKKVRRLKPPLRARFVFFLFNIIYTAFTNKLRLLYVISS